MSDYISREDAKVAAARIALASVDGNITCGEVKRLVDAIPSADAAEVKHGKWIDLNKPTHLCYPRWECSVCHFASHGGNYCPTCGAKMGDD